MGQFWELLTTVSVPVWGFTSETSRAKLAKEPDPLGI